MKNERIDVLEKEIAELRNDFQVLKSNNLDGSSLNPVAPSGQQSTLNQIDTLNEMQERCVRSKNIIVFNIQESNSTSPSERVDHDKAHVIEILEKLQLDTITEYKVVRVGRAGTKPRPMKVMFSDSSFALKCIKNKK